VWVYLLTMFACLLTGAPYKKRVFGLSFDRKREICNNDDNCLLIGTRLNYHTQKGPIQPSGPRKLLRCTARKWASMNLLPIMQRCVLYSGLSS
jgi:hypothetical protein